MGLAEQLNEARLAETGFVIGARGLEKPGGKSLSLHPNRVYWMGASSSPKMIFVTGVKGDTVMYREYPFDSDRRIQTWVARDLIEKGTRTYLKTYGKHVPPRLKKSLESMLDGGTGSPEKLSDYQPVRVLVKASKSAKADSDAGKDYPHWRQAERYGGVGGLEIGGEFHYEINTDGAGLKAIKKDKKFDIVKVS